jgi:hypothetical protein
VMENTMHTNLGSISIDLNGERYKPPPISVELDLHFGDDTMLELLPYEDLFQYIINS